MDPVNYTSTRYDDRIVSEARSVKVTIPINTTLVAGECFYVAPYLGVAMESATNDGSTTKDIALAVGPLVVATTKLTSGQDFVAGTPVYWVSGTQKFSETRTDIPAGWVYKTKGAESTPVAHILLAGPTFTPVDVTDAQLVVDALKGADLTDIAGISKQAHVADVAGTGKTTVESIAGNDAAAIVTDVNKTGGIVEVLNATRTVADANVVKINAIIKALEDAGILATA